MKWTTGFDMVAVKPIPSYLTGAGYFLIGFMDLPEFHILSLNMVNENPSP